MLGHRTLNAEDYLTILKRRWWVICVPAVIVPAAAVITTYFLTPEYESTSTLLIEPQKVSSSVVAPLDLGTLQNQLSLTTAKIKSRSTLEPIINKYNLYASQHLSMDARVALMQNPQKDLKIAPIDTEISGANGLPGFRVTFTADDPQTAQEVCADITGLYTRNSLQDQQNRTAGTSAFVQTELNESQNKLNDMDHQKAMFEAKYMGSLPGDQATDNNLLGGLGSRLDATSGQIQNLEQTKALMETSLAQATKAEAPAAAGVKTEQADQLQLDKLVATLADLQSHYHDDYPDVKDVKREIADLKAKIAKADAAPAAVAVASAPRTDSPVVADLKTRIRLIDESIAQKTKEQGELQAQMRGYEGRIQASPEVAEQYSKLTRDYQTELANYNKLLAEMNQSHMSTELANMQEGETFTVLDLANLPVDATFPKQSAFALGGLAAGLVLGILIVAFLEYRDTALRTERDIWSFTQLPTLAVIAYSGNINEAASGKTGLLRRLFSRKGPKELLAG